MESAPPFFVRVRDKSHGPFAADHLRELAAGGHIGPATEIASTADGPWARLETLPVAATLFPAGPRDFERANQNSGPPIDLHEIIAAANRPPVALTPTANVPPPPPASAPHDVRSLLQFNLAMEKRRGLHKLKPLFARPSRRRRDYFTALSIIGAVIFTILFVEAYAAVQIQVFAARMPDQFSAVFKAVLFHSPIFAWGLAAFFTFAIALWWLMFVVMDKH